MASTAPGMSAVNPGKFARDADRGTALGGCLMALALRDLTASIDVQAGPDP